MQCYFINRLSFNYFKHNFFSNVIILILIDALKYHNSFNFYELSIEFVTIFESIKFFLNLIELYRDKVIELNIKKSKYVTLIKKI